MSIAEKGYAHPEALVSTEWVAEHLQDPGVRLVESNEDPLVYPSGHIPGAASIPWSQAVQEDGTFKTADDLRGLKEEVTVQREELKRLRRENASLRQQVGRRYTVGC